MEHCAKYALQISEENSRYFIAPLPGRMVEIGNELQGQSIPHATSSGSIFATRMSGS